MGKPKYETPEWRNAPIRAQINEALREIEQLKTVWRDLLRIADTLDEYHRNMIKQKRIDLGNKVSPDKHLYTKLADGAQWTAERELKRLDGWMISLCESEIGLRAMLSSSFNGPRIFQVMRNEQLTLQADRWGLRKDSSWLTPNAL